MSPAPKYRRVLLKLSGEALAGEQKYGLAADTLQAVTQEILQGKESGAQIGLVVGGGNIFRGLSAGEIGMDRVPADHMGMLATIINALALANSLKKAGAQARVLSAISVPGVAEPYVRARALRHLEKGRIVLFAAGTGNPYFTTDTAAVLRAVEVGADAIFKATKVDGVYDSDPVTNPDANKFDTMDYMEVLNRKLRVMDLTAISLCMENKLPIMVFALGENKSFMRAVTGENVGTLISEDPQ